MMPSMDTPTRVVRTLAEVDPQFEQLVKVLYGDLIDPDLIAADAFSKVAPDQADVGTHDSKFERQRKIAVAGVLAGSALGVGAVSDAFHGSGKEAIRGGKALVPLTRKKALTGLGIGTVALGADANEFSVLSNKKKLKPPGAAAPADDRLSKAAVPIATQVAGRTKVLIAASRQIAPFPEAHAAAVAGRKARDAKQTTAGAASFERRTGAPPKRATKSPPTAAAKPAVDTASQAKQMKSIDNWTKFGTGTLQAASSTPGKVLIGAGALTEGAKAYGAHAERKQNQQAQFGKRSDVVWEGEFSKLDDDKRQAFGFCSVIEVNGLPVTDQQNDRIDSDDLEAAAYDYIIKSRKGGRMHERDENDEPISVSDIIESMVFTDEKVAKLGLPPDMPRGWWIGVQVHDPDVWEDVKKRKLGGFSIHGIGKRQDISVDDAMGWS